MPGGGVEEKKAADRNTATPSRIVGLPGVNPDQEILRLENWLRTLVQPRIVGYQFRVVPGFPSNSPVIVVRIPKSLSAPHMVTSGSRFFIRCSSSKHAMDVGELRSAFLTSAEIPERIRRLRVERLMKIAAGETPAIITHDGPRIVLHMVPLESMGGPANTNAAALVRDSVDARPMLQDHNIGVSRINIDGCLKTTEVRTSSGVKTTGYVQFNRSGVVEAVDSYTMTYVDEHITPENEPFRRLVNATLLERILKTAIERYLRVLSNLDVQPPICMLVSFLGAGEYTISTDRHGWGAPHRFDRDELLFPEVFVESYEADLDALVRPMFDAIWQAAGLEACGHYSEDGRWIDAR